MKKLFFVFVLLVGSLNSVGSEIIHEAERTEAACPIGCNTLLCFELPVTIPVPDEVLPLTQIATAGLLQEALEVIATLGESVIGLVPDVITLDVLGIQDGLTIVTAGTDIDLWGVTLSDAAFNAIIGTEGSTVTVCVELIPGILCVCFVISVVGA